MNYPVRPVCENDAAAIVALLGQGCSENKKEVSGAPTSHSSEKIS